LDFQHKHGPYKETFSHQNLAYSTNIPVRYDEEFIIPFILFKNRYDVFLKYYFSSHVFNKLAIALSVIITELDFWNAY